MFAFRRSVVGLFEQPASDATTQAFVRLAIVLEEME
jgi:hypothetical protein